MQAGEFGPWVWGFVGGGRGLETGGWVCRWALPGEEAVGEALPRMGEEMSREGERPDRA